MRVGVNWSYDGSTAATRDIFRALNPDSVVIMSHASQDDYEWLLAEYPAIEFNVRAKTGPGHLGTYPSDILDYREWESERSLRDALELLAGAGKTLRAVMANEPDIEMAVEPVDDPTNRSNAIEAYVDWYWQEVPTIRKAFPDTQDDQGNRVPGIWIAAAPLSQGNPDRFKRWTAAMDTIYHDSDFIAQHRYIPIGGDPAEWGEQ